MDSIRLNELNDLIKKIQKELNINTSNEENNIYDYKLNELTKLLDNLIQDRYRLFLENQSLHIEVEKLQQEIKSNINAIQFINTNINQTSDIYINESIISKNKEFDENIQLLKQNLYNKNKELDFIKKECEKENIKLKEDFTKKEANFIKDINEKNLVIFNENAKLQKKNIDLITERDILIKEFEEYKKSYNKDVFYISKIELDLVKYKKAMDTCTATNIELNNIIVNLTKEVEQLKQEIENNIQDIKEINKSISDTDNVLNKQIKILESNLQIKREELENIKKICIAEKEKLTENYNKQIIELKENAKENVKTILLNNKELQMINKENSKLLSENNKLKEEQNKLQNDYNLQMQQLSNLQSKIDICQTSLNKCNIDLQKCNIENSQLKIKIEELEKEKELEKEISDNDKIKELEKENKLLKQTLENIEDNIEEIYIYTNKDLTKKTYITPIQKNKVKSDIFRLPGDIFM